MKNNYQELMEHQSLPTDAKMDFINIMQIKNSRIVRSAWPRVAVIVACILLLIPMAVLAVDNIFHFGVVEIITGKSSNGEYGPGFEMSYLNVKSRPLNDFPEDIRTFDGYRTVVYDSWKAAEEEMGITLINNDFINGPGFEKQYAYNLKDQGIMERAHCHVFYQGQDNQLYRVNVAASYQHSGMTVEIRSTVTCEHPAISKEKEQDFHWSGILYENGDVDNIQKEEYVGSNGVKATIITATQTGNRTTDYVAVFSVNCASYRIFVSSYAPNRDAEAKDVLIKILEGFVF